MGRRSKPDSQDVRGGFLEMDENVSELLLSVERRQQNHAGILSAYALIAENNPDRNRTVTALLEQQRQLKN